ncbi:hypothetical protein GCM10010319_21470 [Streptomyces blastmyceticus]|uniref:Uncharacterized protein n=1 Tax=Streptomyces blastmyceticus TaxID=68180 RepID=A0ABN0WRH2_9ACTN
MLFPDIAFHRAQQSVGGDPWWYDGEVTGLLFGAGQQSHFQKFFEHPFRGVVVKSESAEVLWAAYGPLCREFEDTQSFLAQLDLAERP